MKVAVYAYSQFTPGTRIFSRNNGKDYLVWLPHGAVVKISVSGDYVNVWVTPSPADWKNTEGLCGFYNGDKADDLMKRDGQLFQGAGSSHGGQPKDFSDNWRVQGAEKIYGGVDSSPFVPAIYCDCQANVTQPLAVDLVTSSCCRYDALLETCERDSSGVEITFDSTFNDSPPTSDNDSRRRRRRSTTATDSQLDDIDIDVTFDPPAIPSSPANIEAAREQCQQFFGSVTVAQACLRDTGAPISESLDSCVEDLLITGSSVWMYAALESYKQLCSQQLSLNSSIPPSVVDQIQKLNCPNECSGRTHGQCIDGLCVCKEGFVGTDCGFALNSSLEFVRVYNGLCDVRSTNCSRVQLIGVGIIPDITRCLAQPVTVNSSGVFPYGTETNILTIFISENEIHCIFPSPTSAYIKLSNENSVSEPSLFVVYDSVCYKCLDTTGSLFTCSQLENSCVIDESCYGPGEHSSNDACLVCTPAQSRTHFSTADTCLVKKSGRANVGLIVGVAVGLTTFVSLAIGLSVCVCIKHRTRSSKLSSGSVEDSAAYDNPGIDISVIPITQQQNKSSQSATHTAATEHTGGP
jgi:hypothetical protein